VEITSADDASRTLGPTLQQLVKIADFQMAQDPANPQPYEWNRLCAWAVVTALPMAENRRTLIPPPDPGFLAAIKAQFAGETLKAIAALEGKIREAIFWLDLNRWSALGLEKLGDKFKPARDAVCGQTALFVKRFPGLRELGYDDGTPFADSETLQWLDAIQLGSGGGTGAPPAAASAGVEAEVAEALSQARGMVRENKLMEAVAMLYERLSRGASAKSKMLWRMTLADVLLSAGQVDLARPHLGDISRQIDEYKLESWDPDLALGALRVVYEGLSRLEDPDSKAAAARTFDQIIRISPAEALKIRR
jgi:type VI secretion system protein VasJ